ncbi:MAG: DUF6789 family protein [Chloroflexota bacterium]
MATTTERLQEQDLCCILEHAKECGCTGPKLPWTILGGFAGTVAITVMMYGVAPMMGLNMDIAQMLGSMLGGSWWAGMMMHFVNGTIIFPFIYAFFLHGVLPGSNAVKGITWGAVLWLTAQAVVMPMMGAGFFSGSVMAAMGSLIGHVAYGWLLGWIAGSSK